MYAKNFRIRKKTTGAAEVRGERELQRSKLARLAKEGPSFLRCVTKPHRRFMKHVRLATGANLDRSFCLGSSSVSTMNLCFKMHIQSYLHVRTTNNGMSKL